jgi:thiamine biosynthesis lipoprotein ApbE
MANRKSSVAKLVSTWGKSKENSIRNPKQREIRQRIVNKQTIKLDNRKAPLKLEI